MPVRREAIELRQLPRWGLGVVGAAGIGGGSVAVFTQDVEAGPVAMMAIGALFLLIGVSGFLPTRLKVGDFEADLRREVGEFVVSAADLLSHEHPEQAVELLEDFESAAPEMAVAAEAARTASIAYEDLVLRMLEGSESELASARDDNGVLVREVSHGGRRFDAVLESSDGTRGVLVVEIKGYTKPIGPAMIREVEERAQSGFRPELVRVLLVTRSRLTLAASDHVSRAGANVHHVRVIGIQDQQRLTESLNAALSH